MYISSIGFAEKRAYFAKTFLIMSCVPVFHFTRLIFYIIIIS